MTERFLILIGSLIIGIAVALLQTYKQYHFYSEVLMTILAVSGSILAIITYLKQNK